VKKLKELYHTLAFVEKYNTGLINTPGKRKKPRGQHRPLLHSSVIPLLRKTNSIQTNRARQIYNLK
jgi:hypothetical protein